MNDLQQKAIDAALCCDWERAIDYNVAIIKEQSDNIQALNRLAKAYMELCQKDQAKEIYKQVLKIDKYNSVALKNLKLLPQKNSTIQDTTDEDFIEEPGITKSVSLVKITNKDILAEIYIKQPVNLIPKNRLVAIVTSNKKQIGSLPDDISFKIKRLMQKNYKYSACVKSVEDNKITIFIRETKRTKRYLDMPSFLPSLSYQTLKK